MNLFVLVNNDEHRPKRTKHVDQLNGTHKLYFDQENIRVEVTLTDQEFKDTFKDVFTEAPVKSRLSEVADTLETVTAGINEAVNIIGRLRK